ncbi:hypothetical protein V6N13_140827 [Hibiscus sabdariffa]
MKTKPKSEMCLERNKVVFKGSKVDCGQLFDINILRLSHWCKASWPVVLMSISDLLSCPSNFALFGKILSSKKQSCWVPPSSGFLKFNTDGAVCGSFDVVAELLAINEALVLFNSSKWYSHCYLIVECDSELVAKWLKVPSSAPSVFKPLIDSVLHNGDTLLWSITVTPRECNELADRLAKQGIARAKDYFEFIDI